MSKNNKAVDTKEKVADLNNDKDKAKEVIESLKVQLLEHQKQAEYHQTMAVKAQGALEVLLQLHPQEEEEKKEN